MSYFSYTYVCNGCSKTFIIKKQTMKAHLSRVLAFQWGWNALVMIECLRDFIVKIHMIFFFLGGGVLSFST